MSIEQDPGSSFEHGEVMGLAESKTLETLVERIADTRFYADNTRQITIVNGQGPEVGGYGPVALMVMDELLHDDATNRKVEFGWALQTDTEEDHIVHAVGAIGSHMREGGESKNEWRWGVNEGFPTNKASLLISRLASDEGMPPAHAIAAGLLVEAIQATDGSQGVLIPEELLISESHERGNQWRMLNDAIEKQQSQSKMEYEVYVELEGGEHSVRAVDIVDGREGHFSDGLSNYSWMSVRTPDFEYEYTCTRVEYETNETEEAEANTEDNSYIDVVHSFSLAGADGQPEHEAIGELTELQARDVIKALERIISHRAAELGVVEL